jgi:NitT/TauT family transport system permease protein
MADTPEPKKGRVGRPGMFGLRRPIPAWQALLFALGFLLVVYVNWTIVTAGAIPEERMVSPTVLPSPAETLRSLPELWVDRALLKNLLVTLRRVVLGFVLAAAVGIPVGVLCGCFSPINAFLLPLTVFGRNIPLAALIPLTFVVFGVGEAQKIMFIFIAAVMFIVADTATAVRDVDQRYVDTALTLGARRWQVVLKVLTPLAMPSVFNSLRLLFGLAFGYIMLAEIVKFGSEAGGVGDIIRISQRRGLYAHVWLILLIIPIVALLMDRALYWIQRELFPHRYGGRGLLNRALRKAIHGWEELKALMWQTRRTKVGVAAIEEAPDE